MTAPYPSGEQHAISFGEQTAVVVEVGGGLREYRVDGFDVVDGYAPEQLATAARGAPLMPWPNRLRDGRYRFDGVDYQLPLTEPAQRNALHGLARWSAWQRSQHAPERVVMTHLLHPQPGYPFTLGLSADYSLSAAGLKVVLTGRNLGPRPAPFGAGQHPYVRVARGLIDGARVRSPAALRLRTDGRQIPVGEPVPVRGKYDLRRSPRLGPRVLDTAFTGLERDPDGLARVVMTGPQRRVTVWLDAGFEHLMLFTGDTLAGAERRRGLGVEPMTCAPNAFQSGLGLRVLEPGEELTASWGITVEKP
ncbi:MAG: aldose epimerase [Chloroflexi bacterium]|nr:MAG: aldose epimerase [Chloroflexota bacterium]